MADQPNTTDTTAPAATVDPQPVTPPAASAAPAVKTFTQEEVDAMIKARLARVERKPEPAHKPEPAKPTEAPASASFADIDRRIAQAEDFATLATAAGLDLDQKRIARSMMAAANPADVSTWWKETIEPLKLGKPPAPPAVQPAALAAPAATAPEAPKPIVAMPAAPSPSNLPTSQGLLDPFSMSVEQHRALGPAGIRKAIDALADIGKQMSGRPQRPVLSRK